MFREQEFGPLYKHCDMGNSTNQIFWRAFVRQYIEEQAQIDISTINLKDELVTSKIIVVSKCGNSGLINKHWEKALDDCSAMHLYLLKIGYKNAKRFGNN